MADGDDVTERREDDRDPIQAAAGRSRDLYDVATWERRTPLDAVASLVYRGLRSLLWLVVVVLALVVLLAQAVLVQRAAADEPFVGLFVVLSILPALGLVGYIWYVDPTTRESVGWLLGTFFLGVLFAGFAAVANSLLEPLVTWIPLVGMAVFFYLVVAPVEETVKWLAVRLGPFGSERFDAVVDGAVYGAMAGLGFATIENALYIGRQYLSAVQAGNGALVPTLGTTAVRSLAGPGHVIYSAFAGYYLGLAKFNADDAGPIVVKGLLIAAFVHGTYNTLVNYLPAVVEFDLLTFLGFVVVYDGIFAYLLYRKLSRYRSTYESVA